MTDERLAEIRERWARPMHDDLALWAFRMESGLDCAGSSSSAYFGEVHDLAKRGDENLASELVNMVAWLEPHNRDVSVEMIRVLLGARSAAPTDISDLLAEVERLRDALSECPVCRAIAGAEDDE